MFSKEEQDKLLQAARGVVPDAPAPEASQPSGSAQDMPKGDSVNHPSHYTSHPSGVECVTIIEHFNFNIGNAIKYLWRAGMNGDAVEDLKKSVWYVNREIDRLTAKP